MEGFFGLVGAMVLKNIDRLSDEDTPDNGAGSTEGPNKEPVAKAKPVPKDPKSKTKSQKTTKKDETVVKPPTPKMKRPAAATKKVHATSEPEQIETGSGGTPLKRPAVKGTNSPKKKKIYKYMYKDTGKYGFKIDGSEKFSATHLHFIFNMFSCASQSTSLFHSFQQLLRLIPASVSLGDGHQPWEERWDCCCLVFWMASGNVAFQF